MQRDFWVEEGKKITNLERKLYIFSNLRRSKGDSVVVKTFNLRRKAKVFWIFMLKIRDWKIKKYRARARRIQQVMWWISRITSISCCMIKGFVEGASGLGVLNGVRNAFYILRSDQKLRVILYKSSRKIILERVDSDWRITSAKKIAEQAFSLPRVSWIEYQNSFRFKACGRYRQKTLLGTRPRALEYERYQADFLAETVCT